MGRLLFVVEDVFDINRIGLVVVPGIEPVDDERFRVGQRLRLQRPDGTVVTWPIGGLDMLLSRTRTGKKNPTPVIFRGLPKSELPKGTEVWTYEETFAAKPAAWRPQERPKG